VQDTSEFKIEPPFVDAWMPIWVGIFCANFGTR